MYRIDIPGRPTLELTHALWDFNGTLAVDGRLLMDVVPLFTALQSVLTCWIVTADTHGTVRPVAQTLSCELAIVQTGEEKADIVRQLGTGVAAIGNGYNDIPMMRAAALSIGVLGAEGLSAGVVAVADILVPHVTQALELLRQPHRIVATLRR